MMGLRALAALIALAPLPAMAHPHIFIDGGVDFVFDGAGQITALRITWIYDPLTTLFMLEDLGLDPLGAESFTAEQRASIATYQTEWAPDFEGDSYLWDGDRRIGLSGPLDAEAEVDAGQAIIRFTRPLDAPLRPGPQTETRIYDPTYFTAYAITQPPRLEGAPAECRAKTIPFTPEGPLLALQQTLLTIGVDTDPEDPDVGALFAERVQITCD